MSEMRERIARAIYDAADPNSGDHVATTLHLSDHAYYTGEVAEQLEQVMNTCRAIADAVLDAMMELPDELADIGRANNYGKYPNAAWQAMLAAAKSG